MDSDLPLPAKRLRTSLLSGNLQLTECVREFKLPRQYPSMVTKVNTDSVNEKNKLRPHFNASAVTCLPKSPIQTKIVTNTEIPARKFLRKIKLKGKDGRDLGEVNIQDLTQNIQGKTITLAKNAIVKSPEIVSPADKSKGVTIGVLTPVNIVKSEKSFVNNLPSVSCVKDQKEMTLVESQKSTINDQKLITNGKKPVIPEQKLDVTDPQSRPQVLVFQQGANWHMVKLTTAVPLAGNQNGKKIVMGKMPPILNCGKATILQAKEQSQNFRKETSKSESEKSTVNSKISSTNQSYSLIRNVADRCKSKSPVCVTENVETRPKIEISRVFGPVTSKSISQISTTSQIHTAEKKLSENTKSTISTGQVLRNSLRKDEMVVLPSDIPDSLDSDSEFLSTKKDAYSSNPKISNFSPKFSETIENVKSPATRDLCSTRSAVSDEKSNEISSRLDILTKALSTVEDKELRAKALKALADCGIGMERLVPICPPSEMKPVKDSGTQTPVFGIVEPEHFVYVTQENPQIERIRPIERKAPQKIGNIIGNPHPQELSFNTLDLPNWVTPNACTELDAMVAAFVEGDNEGVSEVKHILADKPSKVSPTLISRLIEDFQSYKIFDEDGLLALHRAVINDDPQAVTRLLTIFRGENPDVLTSSGETSLELAVRHEVSVKIVKMLLEAGAEPTSSEIGHDSALIIASKKSLPILKELIPYVTTRKSLDNYDSSGFAALHYCAQNNNKSGVIELAKASADVNVRDRRSGRTPLFHAVENEHIELAQLLLDKGAQANIPNFSGHTVFALLEESKHFTLTESLNRINAK